MRKRQRPRLSEHQRRAIARMRPHVWYRWCEIVAGIPRGAFRTVVAIERLGLIEKWVVFAIGDDRSWDVWTLTSKGKKVRAELTARPRYEG